MLLLFRTTSCACSSAPTASPHFNHWLTAAPCANDDVAIPRSGNEWAYGANDIQAAKNGVVLDVGRHAQFLGALQHHRDVTGLPIITDFYSPTCGPCKMIAPTVSALAKEFAGKAVFLKINSNVNMETSSLLGISGLPTFVYAFFFSLVPSIP